MPTLIRRLERYFQFGELQTNWRTEIVAGFTTFMTMAYIIFVNPSMLHKTGMPMAAVVAATCLCSAFGSSLMGAFIPSRSRRHGAECIFHLHRHTAHARAVADRSRSRLPVGCGFPDSDVGRRPPQVGIGLLLIAARLAWRVKEAIPIGILVTTAAGVAFSLEPWRPQLYSFTNITATAFRLNVVSTARLGFLEIVFVFLFVDLFDNVGTLVAVGKKARLFTEARQDSPYQPRRGSSLRRFDLRGTHSGCDPGRRDRDPLVRPGDGHSGISDDYRDPADLRPTRPSRSPAARLAP